MSEYKDVYFMHLKEQELRNEAIKESFRTV